MTLSEYMNSQFSLWQNVDFFLRIAAACVCGACIGAERSKRYKEAGIRTHIIVCCASALLMIVSKYGFADLTDPAGAMYSGIRGADPARIAAQVVSGISFLGAGVIFKHGNAVRGLTTAAGLWATVGIGMCASMGQFLLSSGTKGKRFLTSHARVLMPQPSGGIGGTTTDVRISAELIMNMKKTLAELTAGQTGHTVEEIYRDNEYDHSLRRRRLSTAS